MNPKNLFEENLKLKEAFISGANDAFEDEDDANAHANHFNLSVRKVSRGEFLVETQTSEEKTDIVKENKAKN